MTSEVESDKSSSPYQGCSHPHGIYESTEITKN